MGAWEYGIMDDDVAGDLLVTWNEYIVRGRERDPEFWTAEQIVGFFQQYYLTSKHLDARDVDVARLAIGALMQRDGVAMPLPLVSDIVIAASRELSRERLALWDSPIKRKRAVLAFLASLGREPVPPPKETEKGDALRKEVKLWKEFSKQYPRWVEVSRGRFGEPKEFFDLVPNWFFQLQDFVGKGLRHDNTKLMAEGMHFRLMFVAWYTGFLLRLPDDERLHLIHVAERIHDDWFIMPSE